MEAANAEPSGPSLGWKDRFIPLWILLAMTLGVALGALAPDLGGVLDSI